MKEYKIVSSFEWDSIQRERHFNRESEKDNGWSVDQVIAKPRTYIEYEYVLVREIKPA